MSLNNVPSKAEVMGWSSQSLADLMRKLKLTGCDKVVMKGGITGAKFLQMTECDLQLFPSLYISIVTKLQSEINKGGQKKPFSLKSIVPKFPKKVLVQKEDTWDSDEFENESDHDDDGYICALAEAQTAGQEATDESCDEDYEVPSLEDPPKPPRRHSRVDSVPNLIPAERTSKSPHPPLPRMHLTPRPYKAPAAPSKPNPFIDRSEKPGHSGPPQIHPPKQKGGAVKAPISPTSKVPQPRAPKPPRDVPNRAGKQLPPTPTPAPAPRQLILEALDPSWYAGKVTRPQAEAALREVNEDGAFVVRDSSKGEVEHPYTLMLLKQGKVYNIKIRKEGGSYTLGNGFNNKSFPEVKEMITHHAHTPLLLIDAADQSYEAQSHCCLLHPAGL